MTRGVPWWSVLAELVTLVSCAVVYGVAGAAVYLTLTGWR